MVKVETAFGLVTAIGALAIAVLGITEWMPMTEAIIFSGLFLIPVGLFAVVRMCQKGLYSDNISQ